MADGGRAGHTLPGVGPRRLGRQQGHAVDADAYSGGRRGEARGTAQADHAQEEQAVPRAGRQGDLQTAAGLHSRLGRDPGV